MQHSHGNTDILANWQLHHKIRAGPAPGKIPKVENGGFPCILSPNEVLSRVSVEIQARRLISLDAILGPPVD